ncbi:hypothetical protein COLU111180_15995 [Cohnella lubricantis]|uniref:Uncharacterized protein n=1 Tax=Cohnella lubricantis TaxID=2163172 RepID=A0A841TIG5_9BACL|nr:hypothetical protein [Cohnella lubricantis]MBB6679669.1 hypothetical protein [Cohnella lubricantis]MBP2119911.1 hypothetical protein [Cohnella lubricantis]
MDPTDKELREQLSHGPLIKSGFDDRLRRRIETQLDRPRRRFGRTTRFGWSFAGAAAAVLALVFFGIWQLAPFAGEKSSESLKLADPVPTALASTVEQDNELNTGLLIGLRKDVTVPDGRIVSSYRTVLVAPENDKLEVSAEGPGIVMPYKMTFWKIEATPDDGDTESQSLIAYQAYGSKALTEHPSSVVVTPRPGLLSERILYVGKQYVSVAEDAAGVSADESDKEYRFVKDIKQLAASAGTAFVPEEEPHVSYADTLAEEEKEAATPDNDVEQWAIIRKPGQWAGASYSIPLDLDPNGEAIPASPDEFRGIDPNTSFALPGKLSEDVAPHDDLDLTWEQIRRIEPSAVDAYTYEDLLATVVDREIKIYPYKQKDGLNHPLAIELEPNESIIMVQWALNQSESKNYVDQWKVKIAQIFGQQ